MSSERVEEMAQIKAFNRNTKKMQFNLAFVVITVFIAIVPALASAYFGFNIHTAMSGSMEPKIKPGDEMISDVIAVKNINVGDIVLLLNPDNMEMVSHRVVAKTSKDGVHWDLTTKGDANSGNDPVQTMHGFAPIRRVTFVIPKVGYVLDALSSTAAKSLGALGLIAFTVLSFMNYRRRLAIGPLFVTSPNDDAAIEAKVKALLDQHIQKISSTTSWDKDEVRNEEGSRVS